MQTQSEQTTKAPFICLKRIEVDFPLQDSSKISEPNSLRLLSYCKHFKIQYFRCICCVLLLLLCIVVVVCCRVVVVTLLALNLRFLPHSFASSVKIVLEVFTFLGF